MKTHLCRWMARSMRIVPIGGIRWNSEYRASDPTAAFGIYCSVFISFFWWYKCTLALYANEKQWNWKAFDTRKHICYKHISIKWQLNRLVVYVFVSGFLIQNNKLKLSCAMKLFFICLVFMFLLITQLI